MGKTRRLLIVLVLLMSASCAFASLAYRPSVTAWFGGVFCHPEADYLKEYPGDETVEMPKFRTSCSFGFDVKLVDISWAFGKGDKGSVQIGCGISYMGVSRSLAYGISILKPYSALGTVVDLTVNFSRRLGVDLKYRYLKCHFTGTEQSFIAHDFEVSPTYRFINEAFTLGVALPVSLTWKADALSLRTSVAVVIGFDTLGLGSEK